MDVTYIEQKLLVHCIQMTNRCNNISGERMTRALRREIFSYYLWAWAKFWFPFYVNNFIRFFFDYRMHEVLWVSLRNEAIMTIKFHWLHCAQFPFENILYFTFKNAQNVAQWKIIVRMISINHILDHVISFARLHFICAKWKMLMLVLHFFYMNWTLAIFA